MMHGLDIPLRELNSRRSIKLKWCLIPRPKTCIRRVYIDLDKRENIDIISPCGKASTATLTFVLATWSVSIWAVRRDQ